MVFNNMLFPFIIYYIFVHGLTYSAITEYAICIFYFLPNLSFTLQRIALFCFPLLEYYFHS